MSCAADAVLLDACDKHRNDEKATPEGDHSPRTPMVKVHVVPSPPAPATPRQDTPDVSAAGRGIMGTGMEEGNEILFRGGGRTGQNLHVGMQGQPDPRVGYEEAVKELLSGGGTTKENR